MFDSVKDLLDKIWLGEDTFLELKEVHFSGCKVRAPHRDSLADELAAFANGRGGVCLLGVEDKQREIVGIPVSRLDTVEEFIHEICNDSVEPPLIPVIERTWLPATTGEDVAVVKVEVQRSLFVHRSPGGFLHRVGSDKRIMPTEYLARLFQQRSQARTVRFDEQVVPDAMLDDLSSEIWGSFRTLLTRNETEDLLVKLHMVRPDTDGSPRPTVAGVLMASPDARRWLPNAYIQAVAYRGTAIRTGTNDPYQLDAADISGPLNTQVVLACQFVTKNMTVAAFKDQGRTDQPQFDMGAVFEAVVNAVAHRDYSIHGSKIRLRLFQDRLEIYSPGAIPNTMNVEDLLYLQATRNETIASLLAKCPVPANIPGLITGRETMMDRRGEGVPVIFDNSLKLSGKEPEYRLIGDAELLLTIYAAGPVEDKA